MTSQQCCCPLSSSTNMTMRCHECAQGFCDRPHAQPNDAKRLESGYGLEIIWNLVEIDITQAFSELGDRCFSRR